MVRVQVRPSQPVAFGHAAKYWMIGPAGAAGTGRDHHQKRLGFLHVRCKFDWPGSSDFLIDFRDRQNSSAPLYGEVQRHPLDERSPREAAGIADTLLIERHPKRITEMTDHLVCGHTAPLPLAFRFRAPKPPEKFTTAFVVRQGLHSPSSRSPPAARNASSACLRPASASSSSDAKAGVPRSRSNCGLADSVATA